MITTKKTETVPTNYTLCVKGDCPKSTTCLRHKATQLVPAEVQTWSILSPAYLAQMEGECPMYRSAWFRADDVGNDRAPGPCGEG